MTTTQIDLQSFCALEGDSVRYPLLVKPFVQGGVRYATDGRIIVAVPAPGEPDTEGKFPRAADIFGVNGAVSSGFEPWPSSPFVIEEKHSCKNCEGIGFVNRKTCDKCDGDGEVECYACGHFEECCDCHGNGFVSKDKCPSCMGAKEVVQPWLVEVCGMTIWIDYANRIAALPNVVVCKSSRQESALEFEFDGGGRGLVMERTRT